MAQASKVLINLVGVPSHLHWDAVLKALVNYYSITREDLLLNILPGEKSKIILVITRDDVSHETTIGEVFEKHPELLATKKFERCTYGRSASKSGEDKHTNEQKLDMLSQVFRSSNTVEGDIPALAKGDYWVFLTEADGITVTVTDIAKEWRRLAQLVYKPSS
jgi:hypothetical protein